MPLSEDDAKTAGWTLLSNDCKEDNTTRFHGSRYIHPDNVERSVLIYDSRGKIAGIQLAFDAAVKAHPYRKYVNAHTKITDTDDGVTRYYMTAYFTEPNNICTANDTAHTIGSNKLIFVTGDNQYMEVPLISENVTENQGKWIK